MIHFLIALALCYVLIKIPFWVVGSIRGGGRSFVTSVARGFIAYKTLDYLRGAGSASGNATPTPRGGGPTSGAPPNTTTPRATPSGQYMLPLNVTRIPRSPRPPAADTPRPRRSSAGKGRQLALPADGEWPENKPRLGRDGQYQLPLPVARRRAPSPPPAADPRAQPRPPPLPLPKVHPPRPSTRRGGET